MVSGEGREGGRRGRLAPAPGVGICGGQGGGERCPVPSCTCSSVTLWNGVVAAGYGNGQIRLYEAATGVLRAEVNAHARWIYALDLAPQTGKVRLAVPGCRGPCVVSHQCPALCAVSPVPAWSVAARMCPGRGCSLAPAHSTAIPVMFLPVPTGSVLSPCSCSQVQRTPLSTSGSSAGTQTPRISRWVWAAASSRCSSHCCPRGCGVGAALRSLWCGTAATESSSALGGNPAGPV